MNYITIQLRTIRYVFKCENPTEYLKSSESKEVYTLTALAIFSVFAGLCLVPTGWGIIMIIAGIIILIGLKR